VYPVNPDKSPAVVSVQVEATKDIRLIRMWEDLMPDVLFGLNFDPKSAII
jgi:hypothetical protein